MLGEVVEFVTEAKHIVMIGVFKTIRDNHFNVHN
jgi:hypothetical protein